MCEHDHNHEHHHEHHDHVSPEERLALLTYLLGHNRDHAQELHELAHGAAPDVADLLHEAVDAYNEGNTRLEEALALLKEV